MYEVEHLLAIQNTLGEGPLWSVEEQRLYWVDIDERCFYRLDPAARTYERYEVGTKIGALALNKAGGFVLAAAAGLGLWRIGDNQITYLEDTIAYKPRNRFNDGAVDRAGRFWAGTASDEPVNALYRLDSDRTIHLMENHIYTSNGIGWSPDNRIMYYSDSGGPGVVYAYDFDLESGSISNRRVFLPPTGTDAVADGLTVDSEGCVWVAYWNGWKVARYDPQGNLMRAIRMPVQRPTSCNFGGPDLNELYVTSASTGLSAAEKQQQPMAGDLFRIHTDVTGIPEPMANVPWA